MRVRAKLFGILRKKIPHYDPESGIIVDIKDGATVNDLVAHLGLDQAKMGMVSMNGRLVKADQVIDDESLVRIFQPIFGG